MSIQNWNIIYPLLLILILYMDFLFCLELLFFLECKQLPIRIIHVFNDTQRSFNQLLFDYLYYEAYLHNKLRILTEVGVSTLHI